jgi:hypothetical protein
MCVNAWFIFGDCRFSKHFIHQLNELFVSVLYITLLISFERFSEHVYAHFTLQLNALLIQESSNRESIRMEEY